MSMYKENQLQVGALSFWSHPLKTGLVFSGEFCSHILFSLLDTFFFFFFFPDRIGYDKHMLANNNEQP